MRSFQPNSEDTQQLITDSFKKILGMQRMGKRNTRSWVGPYQGVLIMLEESEGAFLGV